MILSPVPSIDDVRKAIEESRANKIQDKIARAALNGMLAHPTRYKPRSVIESGLYWHDAISKEAYEIADAMLKAREKSYGR